MSITLADVNKAAIDAGLGPEGAKAAQAIAKTEGALAGQVGDNGTSFGPFQFHIGGQLNAFASALNMSLSEAGKYATENPDAAIKWALDGYLGNAIRAGINQGLTGPALATYAQQYGQRSVSPENAGKNWTALFGNSSTPSESTNPVATSLPAVNLSSPSIDIPGLSGLADWLGQIGTLLGNTATSTTNFFSGITNTIGWVFSPQTIKQFVLVGIGGMLLLIGLVLFGVSFLPKNTTVPVPV